MNQSSTFFPPENIPQGMLCVCNFLFPSHMMILSLSFSIYPSLLTNSLSLPFTASAFPPTAHSSSDFGGKFTSFTSTKCSHPARTHAIKGGARHNSLPVWTFSTALSLVRESPDDDDERRPGEDSCDAGDPTRPSVHFRQSSAAYRSFFSLFGQLSRLSREDTLQRRGCSGRK